MGMCICVFIHMQYRLESNACDTCPVNWKIKGNISYFFLRGVTLIFWLCAVVPDVSRKSVHKLSSEAKGIPSVIADKQFSKLPYPRVKLMITANRQVTCDVEQFVDIPVPGVLSLGRASSTAPLPTVALYRSGERVLGRTQYGKILYTFL